MEHPERPAVQRGVDALPGEAESVVRRIEALIAQAAPLLGSGSDDAAYAIRETERRYLPDTIKSYLDVPPARRNAAAAQMLIEQLALLERATAARLAALADSATTALAANGAFLTERFGSLESLPQAPVFDPGDAPATTLVARLFEHIQNDGPAEYDALLERMAAQFSQVLPSLTAIRRRGIFGNGAVASIVVELPYNGNALRYAIARTGAGGIDASVTKIVRGVALRTERCSVAEWLRAIAEDLAAYAERERSARDVLTRLFAR